MSKLFRRIVITAAASVLAAGPAAAQYPIIDMVANRVIQKYQGMTCEQLWQQKGQPKSPEEQNAIAFLKNDPQARTVFINQVAGPVVNKMFECGMVP
jgi:hypothetical protein